MKGKKPIWWKPSPAFSQPNCNQETETREQKIKIKIKENASNRPTLTYVHKLNDAFFFFLFFPPSLLMRFLFTNPIKTPLRSSNLFYFRNSPQLGLLDSVRSLRVTSPSSLTTQRSSLSMAAIPPKSPSTEEEGLARRFWIKFKRESVFAMYSPFTVSLASGNLKLETFRHYIAQDFHFLKAFAQA